MQAVTSPKIRVVVLNFNGGSMVVDALRHVLDSEWPADRLEVICVDNASTDGSIERISDALPAVAIRRNDANLGFPGNNSALSDLDDIEFVALVNSDAYVDPGWLQPLVDALGDDRGLGAVCPKILLASRFVEVTVTSHDPTIPVLLRDVLIDGESVFARVHTGPDTLGRRTDGGGVFEELHPTSVVRVPSEGGAPRLAVELHLDAPAPTTVRLDGGAGVLVREVAPGGLAVTIDVVNQPFDVLNNVGSLVFEDGYGADRGYLERDLGQFDQPSDVFAWCGGAVLLRAAYMRDVGLFDPSYFLYYEDVDLSWRGAMRGWRYRTVPTSVVRHEHSATSVEGSSLFVMFNERNRLISVSKNGTVGQAFRQIPSYCAATLSYAIRDIIRPLLRGRRPSTTIVASRSRALLGFVASLPRVVRSRRKVQKARLVDHQMLTGSFTARPD